MSVIGCTRYLSIIQLSNFWYAKRSKRCKVTPINSYIISNLTLFLTLAFLKPLLILIVLE